MYYAIWSSDGENVWEKRKAARPKHLERLQQLVDEGRVLLGGPLPLADSDQPDAIDQAGGMSGSLLVVAFDSLSAAKAWADADPYVEAGVYSKVEVKPFIKVVP